MTAASGLAIGLAFGLAVDHLVIGAASLGEGVAWCESVLGVTPGPGGQHPLMGTHNRLLRLQAPAAAPAYLEIIAIDPQAPAPGRARWFGLDAANFSAGPRLLHWVARCAALEPALAALHALGLEVGRPQAAERQTPQGRLAWRLNVRDDGALLAGGALPTLIEWGAVHPSTAMPPAGLVLRGLSLRGVTASAASVLAAPGVAFVESAGSALTAVLDTPRGRVILESF